MTVQEMSAQCDKAIIYYDGLKKAIGEVKKNEQ